MSVAVVSKTGMLLMPTSEYRARKLLKSKKAIIHGYHPFTIQLTERETGYIQPVELCMDTGYIHIGTSVKSEKHEYLGEQIDTLTDERQKHDACRMYRRQRRNRKRYRQPRFNNRERDDGWIAPSLEHKKTIHIQALSRICKVIPVTDITLEMGNFDTQVLKAREEGRPLPQGLDYQHGERYSVTTLREAVFLRDGYTCQRCGRTIKDGAILHVHHVVYRSQGGTNRISNLITICDKCHTPANHKPGGKLYGWKPKVASFKGATYMTTIRWKLYNEIKALFPDIDIHITYGAETKERRRAFDITKSHVNDAFVMGQFHPKYRSKPVCYKKKRRTNLITICDKCHTPANHKPGGKLYGWKPKVASFKGATYMTTIRWKLYNEIKALFPDIDIHITYGAETKERRRAFDITKSHVNDAFVMGQFHPKYRSKPVCYKKKRRNNRCLEKFYDAKYIDSRNGKTRTGQELFNGRISRNHKKDSENLHQYRRQKISTGKRTIRKQHYAIQPHDIVIFNGEKFETSGCHNNGTRVILLPQKKSVAIKKLNIYRYAGGYFKSAFNQK